MLQINTTQNVKINFEMANVGQRLFAFVIDNVLKIAYFILIINAFNFTLFNEASGGDYWSVQAINILMFLPITFYSLYCEVLLNGQTLGKKILKLRVINIEGFKPSVSDYIIRWFLRLVDFNLFILLFVYFYSETDNNDLIGLTYTAIIIGKMVGFFAIIFTDKNQRIGDMAANTVVVSLKDEASFSKTILEELKENYKPRYPNVIKLSDNDVRIIKDTFIRAKSNRDYNTLIKLRTKIEDVTTISKNDLSDIEFIEIILKDFNYYTKD